MKSFRTGDVETIFHASSRELRAALFTELFDKGWHMAGDARTALEQRLRKRILAIKDVEEGEQVFGDRERNTAWFVDAKQMANLVGVNTLALRLSKAEISRLRPSLKADLRVTLKSGSDWMSISFADMKDVAFAVELAEVAAATYRRRDGLPPKHPPSGPDLARRRRFH